MVLAVTQRGNPRATQLTGRTPTIGTATTCTRSKEAERGNATGDGSPAAGGDQLVRNTLMANSVTG